MKPHDLDKNAGAYRDDNDNGLAMIVIVQHKGGNKSRLKGVLTIQEDF